MSLGCGQKRRDASPAAADDAPPEGPKRRRFARRRRRTGEDVPIAERVFRSLGLSWEHEPRIRRAARSALKDRGAYVRLEPVLEDAVGLAETDEAKIDKMAAQVQAWLADPAQCATLDDIAAALDGAGDGDAPWVDTARAGARRIARAVDGARRGAAASLPGATRWPVRGAFRALRRRAERATEW